MLGLSPIGASVLVLLIVHGCAVAWRRVLVRQGFLMVWLVFVACRRGGGAAAMGADCLLTFHLFPLAPALFEFGADGWAVSGLATLFTVFVRARGIAASLTRTAQA